MNNDTANVVFLDRGSLLSDELDFKQLNVILPNCEFYENSSVYEVHDRIRHADIVITNKAIVSKVAISQARNLKMISVTATGYNNIDIEEARKRGILVSNVRSYATQSVVQHVFMMIFVLATRFIEYNRLVKEGKWSTSEQFCLLNHKITEISGKTLGVIGHGELGKAVVRVADCFGMKTLVAERRDANNLRDDRTQFEEMLVESDVISIHCPLVQETRNLIGKRELKMMKNSSILINAARGGIVDEMALREALVMGEIGGAGIDVLMEEPPINGNILLDKNIPNLIVTPHIAWASLEAQQRLLDKAVYNIASFLNGCPTNIVS